MKICLQQDALRIDITLGRNEASAELAAQLPLTLTVEDFHATEKIAQLPRKLASAGRLPGTTPAPGEVAYYAPWGNLALFYRDAPYSGALVHLGRGDAAAFESLETGRVRIERIPD